MSPSRTSTRPGHTTRLTPQSLTRDLRSPRPQNLTRRGHTTDLIDRPPRPQELKQFPPVKKQIFRFKPMTHSPKFKLGHLLAPFTTRRLLVACLGLTLILSCSFSLFSNDSPRRRLPLGTDTAKYLGRKIWNGGRNTVKHTVKGISHIADPFVWCAT